MREPPDTRPRAAKQLHKFIYGLKQASRKWYEALSCTLTDLEFRASSADPGVFLAKVDKHIFILAIHVDDCTLTGSSPELIAECKCKFNDRYTLTDLGPIHWFLDHSRPLSPLHFPLPNLFHQLYSDSLWAGRHKTLWHSYGPRGHLLTRRLPFRRH
jgi:hypothetical protein